MGNARHAKDIHVHGMDNTEQHTHANSSTQTCHRGRAMARIVPGNPAPEPTSMSLSCCPSTNGWACASRAGSSASESWMCFSTASSLSRTAAAHPLGPCAVPGLTPDAPETDRPLATLSPVRLVCLLYSRTASRYASICACCSSSTVKSA